MFTSTLGLIVIAHCSHIHTQYYIGITTKNYLMYKIYMFIDYYCRDPLRGALFFVCDQLAKISFDDLHVFPLAC